MKDSLVTDDIIKLVQSNVNNATSIKNYDFDNHNTFNVGRVNVVYNVGNKPILDINENVTGKYMGLWNKDVGRVLVRELKKNEPQLFELITNNFKVLLKKISEEESDDFKDKGFDHIVIGDFKYTIIKAVTPKKKYSDVSGDYNIDFDIDENNENESYIIESDEKVEEIADENNSYELF